MLKLVSRSVTYRFLWWAARGSPTSSCSRHLWSINYTGHVTSIYRFLVLHHVTWMYIYLTTWNVAMAHTGQTHRNLELFIISYRDKMYRKSYTGSILSFWNTNKIKSWPRGKCPAADTNTWLTQTNLNVTVTHVSLVLSCVHLSFLHALLIGRNKIWIFFSSNC